MTDSIDTINEILINLADSLVNAGAALRAQVRGDKIHKPKRDHLAEFGNQTGVKPKAKSETVQAPIPQKPTLCPTCGKLAVYRIHFDAIDGRHECHDVCANCGDFACECEASDVHAILRAAEVLHGSKCKSNVVRTKDMLEALKAPETKKKFGGVGNNFAKGNRGKGRICKACGKHQVRESPSGYFVCENCQVMADDDPVTEPKGKQNPGSMERPCPMCHGPRAVRRINGLRRWVCTTESCGYVAGTDKTLQRKPAKAVPETSRKCPSCKVGVYRYRRVNGENHWVCDDCKHTSSGGWGGRKKIDRTAEIAAAHQRILERKNPKEVAA